MKKSNTICYRYPHPWTLLLPSARTVQCRPDHYNIDLSILINSSARPLCVCVAVWGKHSQPELQSEVVSQRLHSHNLSHNSPVRVTDGDSSQDRVFTWQDPAEHCWEINFLEGPHEEADCFRWPDQ